MGSSKTKEQLEQEVKDLKAQLSSKATVAPVDTSADTEEMDKLRRENEILRKQTKLMGNKLKIRLNTSWPNVSYDKTYYTISCSLQDPTTLKDTPAEGEIDIVVPTIIEKNTGKIVRKSRSTSIHFEKGKAATNDLEAAYALRSNSYWCNIHQHDVETMGV